MDLSSTSPCLCASGVRTSDLCVLDRCTPGIKLLSQGQLFSWGWGCPSPPGLTNLVKMFVLPRNRKNIWSTNLHKTLQLCSVHPWAGVLTSDSLLQPTRIFSLGSRCACCACTVTPRGFHWLPSVHREGQGQLRLPEGREVLEESHKVLLTGVSIFCVFPYITAKYSHHVSIALIMNDLYCSCGLWYCSLESQSALFPLYLRLDRNRGLVSTVKGIHNNRGIFLVLAKICFMLL